MKIIKSFKLFESESEFSQEDIDEISDFFVEWADEFEVQRVHDVNNVDKEEFKDISIYSIVINDINNEHYNSILNVMIKFNEKFTWNKSWGDHGVEMKIQNPRNVAKMEYIKENIFPRLDAIGYDASILWWFNNHYQITIKLKVSDKPLKKYSYDFDDIIRRSEEEYGKRDRYGRSR